MKGKWLFLTLLISLSAHTSDAELCADVGSEKVANALRLQGMKCISKTEKGCQYQECQGKVAGYSKNVMVLLPSTLSSLRVHFHGHKLYKFPEYDQNLSSMVKAFGIGGDICQAQEAVVFPESSGSCADFDRELANATQISTFMKGLHSATGNHLTSHPLHLSAHSGGGRTIGRMLDAQVKTDEVTIFDGIYSDGVKNQVKNWYLKQKGQLNLYSVRGMSPHTYVTNLVNEIKVTQKPVPTKIKDVPFNKLKADRLLVLNRDNNGQEAIKAHYSILSQTWGY